MTLSMYKIEIINNPQRAQMSLELCLLVKALSQVSEPGLISYT